MPSPSSRLNLAVLVPTALLCLHCTFSGRVAAEPAAEKSLASELPRIPPVEPEKALSTFTVQGGYRLELVASEPDVSDPVDACFDESGRMYVAEMHDYPFSHEPTRLNPKGGGKLDAGVIRLLEDTDDDGRMDKSWKFASNITWPLSVCPFNGGVFVIAPPHLWYFKDTDGDHVADVRQVVFTGFNRDNVQALANNLKWGLDHRIYAAGATNPTVLMKDGKELLDLGRIDFSFDPRQEDVRAETGGVQFGHSFDDWGNRFVCSNSNHIQQVIIPYRYISRNPYYTVSGLVRSIAKDGAAAPVFRRSPPEPWRVVRTRRRVADPKYANLPESERVPMGFFTSAAGVTIYRGSADPELRGQAFIGDVGGNLIHRKILKLDDVGFVASRADQNVEFIASTDNWFRPVNFVNAPDGSLYILDMYRETIEHPASIPDDIKEYLNLYSGDDRGRIYRLVGPQSKRQKTERLGELSTAELVRRLDSLNGWTRDTAHRLLWERQDKSAIPLLRTLTQSSPEPLARLHAFWSLDGLSALTADDLQEGLADQDPRVREHAVRLSESFLPSDAFLHAALQERTRDVRQRVLFQLALSLGESGQPAASEILASLLQRTDLVPEVRSAAMTSIGSSADRVLLALIATPEAGRTVERTSLPGDLAQMIGAQPDAAKKRAVLATILNPQHSALLQRAVVRGVGDGLARTGSALKQLLNDRAVDDVTREGVLKFLKAQAALAADIQQSPQERSAAVSLLMLINDEPTESTLSGLLKPSEPQEVQVAAVRSLARFTSANVASRLLERWKGYSPQVRSEVLDALLQTIPRAESLLASLESGDVRSVDLAPDRKQLLLNHANTKLRDRARKLLGQEINSDRAAVIKTYEPALAQSASTERGQATFLKKCSQCHKLGQQGFAVGPEIVSVQNKSPQDLLIAILDPSREAQPAFTSYTVVTTEGRVFNGLIAAESANSITLRRAEGKEDTIDRSSIDELISSGKSLMPDGMEKELTPQDAADVIAFIKSLGKKTP